MHILNETQNQGRLRIFWELASQIQVLLFFVEQIFVAAQRQIKQPTESANMMLGNMKDFQKIKVTTANILVILRLGTSPKTLTMMVNLVVALKRKESLIQYLFHTFSRVQYVIFVHVRAQNQRNTFIIIKKKPQLFKMPSYKQQKIVRYQYSRYDVTTHNPAGYTVINRNDNMIVQPHDTLATDQPTSTQRTLHTVNGHHDVADNSHVGFSTF